MKYYHRAIWLKSSTLHILFLEDGEASIQKFESEAAAESSLDGGTEVTSAKAFNELVQLNASQQSIETVNDYVKANFPQWRF